MALFNEILAGRYNRILQRLLQMKGEAPAPQLSGDIMAGIELESDRPEWGWLGGETRWEYSLVQGGVAAQTSDALFRAITPGVLVTVEAVIVSSDLANRFDREFLANTAAALGTVALGLPRDSRQVIGAGAAQLSTGNNAAALTNTGLTVRQPANQGIVLPVFNTLVRVGANIPTLKFKTAAQNCELDITILTRERPVEASEIIGLV